MSTLDGFMKSRNSLALEILAAQPLPKSLLHLSSAVPWLCPGTMTEPACYNLGRILLWTFQKRLPQLDLHFFKKLNCYEKSILRRFRKKLRMQVEPCEIPLVEDAGGGAVRGLANPEE